MDLAPRAYRVGNPLVTIPSGSGSLLAPLGWCRSRLVRSSQMQEYGRRTSSCSLLPMYKVDRNIRLSAFRIFVYFTLISNAPRQGMPIYVSRFIPSKSRRTRMECVVSLLNPPGR